MAKLTMVFGVLLVLVAVAGFVATGSSHPTSLIPGGVGLLFVLFGVLANSPDAKKRMLWMHVAVTVALLMFLGVNIPSEQVRYNCDAAVVKWQTQRIFLSVFS